jgi:hypothetical protein
VQHTESRADGALGNSGFLRMDLPAASTTTLTASRLVVVVAVGVGVDHSGLVDVAVDVEEAGSL